MHAYISCIKFKREGVTMLELPHITEEQLNQHEDSLGQPDNSGECMNDNCEVGLAHQIIIRGWELLNMAAGEAFSRHLCKYKPPDWAAWLKSPKYYVPVSSPIDILQEPYNPPLYISSVGLRPALTCCLFTRARVCSWLSDPLRSTRGGCLACPAGSRCTSRGTT